MDVTGPFVFLSLKDKKNFSDWRPRTVSLYLRCFMWRKTSRWVSCDRPPPQPSFHLSKQLLVRLFGCRLQWIRSRPLKMENISTWSAWFSLFLRLFCVWGGKSSTPHAVWPGEKKKNKTFYKKSGHTCKFGSCFLCEIKKILNHFQI